MIDAKLLRKYDVPVPRYTSYPTALSFEPMTDVPEPSFGADSGPVSLYFHLPFCRKLCWYCACTKVISGRQSKSGTYLDRLFNEMELRLDSLADRDVVQLHLGGGTPTFFLAEELEALARWVRARLAVSADADFSIEIDPRELNDEQVVTLAKVGFNRASLGVQDHDPRVQKAINRHQPREMTQSAVERLRDAGISALNFDLVYGLPFQTVDSFRKTIEDVIALGPDRLAVYSYAHVPWAAPAQKLVTRDTELPGVDEKIGMFLEATRLLTDAGFVHIGMDHFARPDDDLSTSLQAGTLRRNFMGYTTHRGVDIQAFGASAISQTQDAYFQNHREIAQWEESVDAGEAPVFRGFELDHDDRVRRDVIMQVMCSNRVDLDQVGAKWGIDAHDYFAEELSELDSLAADGLIEADAKGFVVTATGRFLVRNVAATFDARRRSQSGFSKAI